MTAVLGELVSRKARHHGIAGFIVDGLIRDLPAIRSLGDFPVFCAWRDADWSVASRPRRDQHPTEVGGVVVNPGDLVIADLNGAVIVPKDLASESLLRSESAAAAEAGYVAAVAHGEFPNAWIDRLLDESGIPPGRVRGRGQ
jgi:regulator of RNase E activity RraA